MGRPSKYNATLVDSICSRLAQGESLRAICDESETPAFSSVMKWLGEHKEFADKYARARVLQAEFYANQIIEIADEEPKHMVPDPDGGTSLRIDSAGVQRNKLRVDARKWIASKLLPQKYGDSSTLLLGGDGKEPIKAAITVHFVKTGDANSNS